MNPIDPRTDAKQIKTAIAHTKEMLATAGMENVTDELAVLVMIYKEVRPQAEDRVGQHLAKISGTLTAILNKK